MLYVIDDFGVFYEGEYEDMKVRCQRCFKVEVEECVDGVFRCGVCEAVYASVNGVLMLGDERKVGIVTRIGEVIVPLNRLGMRFFRGHHFVSHFMSRFKFYELEGRSDVRLLHYGSGEEELIGALHSQVSVRGLGDLWVCDREMGLSQSRRYSSRVHYICTGEELPFEEGIFDRVSFAMDFRCMGEIDSVILSDLVKTLKVGGLLVLGEFGFDGKFVPERFRFIVSSYLEGSRLGMVFGGIESYLRECGLELEGSYRGRFYRVCCLRKV